MVIEWKGLGQQRGAVLDRVGTAIEEKWVVC